VRHTYLGLVIAFTELLSDVASVRQENGEAGGSSRVQSDLLL